MRPQAVTYEIDMTMDGTMRIEGFGMQDVTMAMSQTVSWKTVKVNADGRLRALKVETSGNPARLPENRDRTVQGAGTAVLALMRIWPVARRTKVKVCGPSDREDTGCGPRERERHERRDWCEDRTRD